MFLWKNGTNRKPGNIDTGTFLGLTLEAFGKTCLELGELQEG